MYKQSLRKQQFGLNILYTAHEKGGQKSQTDREYAIQLYLPDISYMAYHSLQFSTYETRNHMKNNCLLMTLMLPHRNYYPCFSENHSSFVIHKF